jgi:hypothetical protein
VDSKEPITPIERKVLHKERVFTGTHNYFFEVKEASNSSKYLVIDQRRKVGDNYESAKMRIFEDELLEFQRILQKMIRLALSDEGIVIAVPESKPSEPKRLDVELHPPFFDKLLSTNDWQEFERYTHYLLKLLGIQTSYTFLGERQAGRADGFFKFGSLAVMYDCTLGIRDLEENKREQIINYSNRLRQGSLELSGGKTEEFHHHHKQVWVVTRGASRRIKVINDIAIKEVAIGDLLDLYPERLKGVLNDEHLEVKLRNIQTQECSSTPCDNDPSLPVKSLPIIQWQ